MIKKILLAIVVVVLLLVMAVITALLHEKSSLKDFAQYWTAQNKTATGIFTYVALGDSTAQGIGASKATNSYVGLLANRISRQTGQKVRLINLSASGAKIDDVLTKQLPELTKYKPGLITIEIGANDITHYDAKQFFTQFGQLASLLPPGSYVSDMPYFGGRIRANKQALAANVLISKAITGKDLHLVQLQKLTHQRQSVRNYAADAFHPSNRGYINWADAFWQQIQPELAAKQR